MARQGRKGEALMDVLEIASWTINGVMAAGAIFALWGGM
jgi:hypothetical protein